VLAGDVIVGTCGRGGSGVQLAAVRPSAEGASQARVLYTLKEKFVPNVPTPVVLDKWLFLFHDGGLVTCLESKTGNVLWSEKPGGKFFGSPVLIEDRLYCINMKGQVVVLRAADKYERLAVNDLGEASQATPAIADGRMILRTISHLYCIVGEQGQ
jgi:outer membrane protein assembly factor BamB